MLLESYCTQMIAHLLYGNTDATTRAKTSNDLKAYLSQHQLTRSPPPARGPGRTLEVSFRPFEHSDAQWVR